MWPPGHSSHLWSIVPHFLINLHDVCNSNFYLEIKCIFHDSRAGIFIGKYNREAEVSLVSPHRDSRDAGSHQLFGFHLLQLQWSGGGLKSMWHGLKVSWGGMPRMRGAQKSQINCLAAPSSSRYNVWDNKRGRLIALKRKVFTTGRTFHVEGERCLTGR